MALSLKTRRVLASAMANNSSASEINGAIGAWGGFSVNADASLKVVQGDFSVQAQAGIETGSYQLRLNDRALDSQVQAITVIKIDGFTPRAAQTAETCAARLTGWNKDANGWYISVQICTLADNAIDPTPPAGFVIGYEVKLQLTPANIL